jgi:hypothetical protein
MDDDGRWAESGQQGVEKQNKTKRAAAAAGQGQEAIGVYISSAVLSPKAKGKLWPELRAGSWERELGA